MKRLCPYGQSRFTYREHKEKVLLSAALEVGLDLLHGHTGKAQLLQVEAHAAPVAPVNEGVNADEENIRQCIAFLKELPTPPEMVNILPYHDIGIGKHKRLGTEYNPDEWAMSTPSQEWQDHCVELFQSNGFDCKIGG